MELKQLTLFDVDTDYFEQTEMIDESSAAFKVHASLIYKLGESLIADEVTALSELIKNSYDADAKTCMVNIDSRYQEEMDGRICHGMIEVIDNGCGMDFNTIINGWLTLSNSPKKKMKREKQVTPKYHRYPLGDKGLGRLSVQKLGRYMQMTTKMENSETEYIVVIPWGDFLKNTTIDKIPVVIKRNHVTSHQSYTKIIIKDLVDNNKWNQKEQIDFLSNSISKIVSPFRSEDNTFHVVAKINGEIIETDVNAFDELLKTAKAKHLIKYGNGVASICSFYKSGFFYTREISDKILMKKISLTETLLDDFIKVKGEMFQNLRRVKEDGFVFEEVDKCFFRDIVTGEDEIGYAEAYDDPGEFECEIYEYILDSKLIEFMYQNLEYTSIIDRDEYKEFVKRYQGIKVVRDGFLIQGFGEGEEGDWLGLTASSKTTGKYLDLRNESVIGCVYLTGLHNSVLKETTNREGFVGDNYFKNFKKILNESIRRINKNRYKLNNGMREYLAESSINSSSNVDGEKIVAGALLDVQEKVRKTSMMISKNTEKIDIARTKLEAAKNIVRSSPFVPEKSIEYLDDLGADLTAFKLEFANLISERDLICNKIDAISLDFEKLNERLGDLFELAGLGLSVETFTHEFDTSIRNLKQKNQKIANTNEVTVEELMKHINYVTYSLDALRKQMSYFNPGLKYVRAERQIINIQELLEQHKNFYGERCERNSIKFNLSTFSDFRVRANKGMLNQVFDNLFNNSEYWLDFSKKYKYINHKEYYIEVRERGFVLVWDNGVGISRDIENRIFEPFETKKENGRGLGLYIVASNLKYNSSSIRLLGERNKYGNLYKFELNFLEIMQ